MSDWVEEHLNEAYIRLDEDLKLPVWNELGKRRVMSDKQALDNLKAKHESLLVKLGLQLLGKKT